MAYKAWLAAGAMQARLYSQVRFQKKNQSNRIKKMNRSIETNNRISRLVNVVFALFIFSFIYSLIDNYPTYQSAFELGRSTGQMFGYLLKILGSIVFLALTVRSFKSLLLKA
ncbi:hypothetical protein EO244_05760 [Ancylomarina salipaludis]|uniref:Uncharacterized protein n=1 Tax=Ancylomarina salipaludis TaxID=2501299 RepID=A0A4Q1JMZ4_9BACT|nr:hypothetical protein [Ancylomarina salipaludis]RXQ95814.1 hypothetical protein EO244_05760 [Ancylomarina salipaludis]